MIKKKLTAAVICLSVILAAGAAAAGITASAGSGEGLVIEVPAVAGEPGEVIDVVINITSNPGVSVIKDLRIDLGRGLTLYYPQGGNAYENTGTAATWPYVPEKETHGQNTGMLPVMGRPSAANIGDRHIVFNFLDVARPFDSTETGTLITLKVKVDEEASGDIPIRVSGGMYGNLERDGDKEPVLIEGVVKTGIEDPMRIPADAGGGTPEPESSPEPPLSAGQILLKDNITMALQEGRDSQASPDESRETPHIKLTPEMDTVITSDIIREMKDAGTTVVFELEDGTVIEINPADIPTGMESFDLKDLPPELAAAAGGGGGNGGMPVWAIVMIGAGVVLLGAVIVIFGQKRQK